MASTPQNRVRIRLGIEAELSESMRETLRRWSLRQLSTAGDFRERVEAAIVNSDPAEMRAVITGFAELAPVQRRHVTALIDAWEKSLE
jgi:hypothetical protein